MNNLRIFFIFLLGWVCWMPAGEGGAKLPAALQGLEGEVFLLTVEEEILPGKFEPMQDGFIMLRMSDRIMRVAPQVLLGVFSSREDALNAKKTIRELLAQQEGADSSTEAPVNELAGADMSTEEKRQLRQLVKQARENAFKIMQSPQPLLRAEEQISKLRMELRNPEALLLPDTALLLYTVSILPMQRKQQQFYNSLDRLEQEIKVLNVDEEKKNQMKQVLEHARKLHERKGAGKE